MSTLSANFPASFRVIGGVIVPLESGDIKAVSELEYGQFGVAIEGEFKGELFFVSVAGLHGLTMHRYWMSDYMNNQTGRKHGAYRPDFMVRIVTIKA